MAEKICCTKCKVFKFETLEYFPKNTRKNNGLDSWCKECRAMYRSEIRRGLYRSSISDNDLKDLINTKTCIICGEYGDQVDHCHKTNIVRGLLCINCNTGIGKFKDDPMLLEFAKMYLLASVDDEEWYLYKNN